MTLQIHDLSQQYAEAVFQLMRAFYRSPAVSSQGSEDIFRRDIAECLSPGDRLRGYVFTVDGAVAGYAMVAQGFSTEYAKPCLWIEDLYIQPERRSQGIGRQFFTHLRELFPDTVLRLEVGEDNIRAIRMYERCGFTVVPYTAMWTH